MRRHILCSMTAAAMALGLSTATFAAPLPPQHNLGGPNSKIVNAQAVAAEAPVQGYVSSSSVMSPAHGLGRK
jgi:hypothetical protein